jgi:hypothetical protein
MLGPRTVSLPRIKIAEEESENRIDRKNSPASADCIAFPEEGWRAM